MMFEESSIEELVAVLKKFDINPEGPDSKDPIDKQTIIFQTTWVVDFDGNTRRCMQAKKHDQVI
jgi:hypothetical protein